jgi:FHA domain
MAKLMVNRGTTALGSWFIEDKRLTIGRADGVDIKLDNQAVSKQHAAIDVMGADHILLDLGSANGTFVNGAKVTRHLLRHGDTIEVLDFQIRYVDNKSIVGSEGDRTMIFRAKDGELTPVATTPAIATEARTVEINLPTGVLKNGAVKNSSSKRTAAVMGLERPLTAIGDRTRDYAAIFRRPGGFAIARVGGRPPRVDGRPIGDGWHLLREGAVIEIGTEKFEFHIPGGNA